MVRQDANFICFHGPCPWLVGRVDNARACRFVARCAGIQMLSGLDDTDLAAGLQDQLARLADLRQPIETLFSQGLASDASYATGQIYGAAGGGGQPWMGTREPHTHLVCA